jgi:hypothetical protein
MKLSYPGAPVPNAPAPVNQFPNFNSTVDKMASQMNTMSVTQTGFDKIWVRFFSLKSFLLNFFVY